MAAGLYGSFEHTVDLKGRLAIPARFRAAFPTSVVVTKGFDGNLLLYPREAFEARAELYRDMPIDQQQARALALWVFASAHPADIDGQGRILIPEPLREWAGIVLPRANGSNAAPADPGQRGGTRVVVVGHSDHVQVWEYERLRRKNAEVERDAAALAAAVGAKLL